MKLVWTYDEKRQLIGNGKQVSDDYQLGTNETFTEPPEGALAPITFSENGNWCGTAVEDWLATNTPSNVTPKQQAITALAQQVADLAETNKQLEQAITSLATGGDK